MERGHSSSIVLGLLLGAALVPLARAGDEALLLPKGEVPEGRLVDVAIDLFSPGVSDAPPSPLLEKGIRSAVRNSEARWKTKNKAEAITSEISTELPESLEDEITKFYGLRYRLGGDGPRGLDCSGLIKQVYSEAFGINLPRTSSEQSRMGNLEPVAKAELKTGDLVFFGPIRKRVNHVGMYLASGHFLHASSTEAGHHFAVG